MATPVTMPQLGETVIEGTVTRWLKKEGETVARDEPLFEISTDKVDTEVPSPLEGTLVQIKVQEGETVAVGTELAMIDTGDGAGAAGGAATTEPTTAPAGPAPVEFADSPAAVAETPAPADERAKAPAAVAAPASGGGYGGDQSAVLSPLVRRLAEQNNVDLSKVTGTGTGGRIMKSDVENYIKSGGGDSAPAAAALAPAPAPVVEAPLPTPPPAPEPAVAPAAEAPPPPPAPAAAPQVPVVAGEGEELVELSRMRQTIGHHLVASLQTSARAWSLVEVNMESIVRLRAQAKDSFKEREGVGLTYMPFIAKAVCDALMAHPTVNAELRGDQLVLKSYVNLGIAVALDDGLIVPVVKGADSMSVAGLAKAINDVATRARGKQLKPDEVHGSTFTITNPGPYGTLMSVPIINQPNCAILALDTIEKRPVVIDDAIAIRHMVYLSMSWDHRIIDGATAAQFLARLRENLETVDFGPELGLAPQGLTNGMALADRQAALPSETGPPATLLTPRGLVPYAEANELMHDLAARRARGEAGDTLILLEHPPVYTAGRRWKPEHLVWAEAAMKEAGAELHFVDRGGSATFHGPGQLVGYPILDLGLRPDVMAYVHRLEKVVIRACGDAGVPDLGRNPVNSGVWAGDRKVCAIGVRVQRMRWTLHGFALNCTTDLSWYDAIVPCGLSDEGVTTLSQLAGRQITVEEMKPLVASRFAETFDLLFSPAGV